MIGRIVSIVVGLALIVAAVVLYTEPFTPVLAPTDIPNLTRSEAPLLAGDGDPRLVRQPGEAALAFATRVNDEISRAFAHCTPADSVAHGWLLYGLHAAGFTYITEQGMLTSRRNHCGFCHQAAHIEAAALRRSGIAAEAFGLNGHVVVRTTIDGATYYLDPDYGVGPFASGPDASMAIKASYTAILGPEAASHVVSTYDSPDDNQPYYSATRSNEILDAMALQQSTLLIIQDMLLALAVCIGAICLWRGIRPGRRHVADEAAAKGVAGHLPTTAPT